MGEGIIGVSSDETKTKLVETNIKLSLYVPEGHNQNEITSLIKKKYPNKNKIR